MKNGWSPSWRVLWSTAFLKLFFVLFRRTSLLKEKKDVHYLSFSARQYTVYCVIVFSVLKIYSCISVHGMRKAGCIHIFHGLNGKLLWICFWDVSSPAQYCNTQVLHRCQNFFYHIFLLTFKLFPLAFCTYFFKLACLYCNKLRYWRPNAMCINKKLHCMGLKKVYFHAEYSALI